MRRPTRVELGLGVGLLLAVGGFSVWVWLCFQTRILYPASFREVIEHEFSSQLASLADAAQEERELEPSERSALDAPEILEVTTWHSSDPSFHAGRMFKDTEWAKKRYSTMALFRSYPSKGSPGLNHWMTRHGDLIEYEQNVVAKGGYMLGYTVIFDAKLLEQRKAEYEASGD